MKIILYSYGHNNPIFETTIFNQMIEKIESIKNTSDYFVFFNGFEYQLNNFVSMCERNFYTTDQLEALQLAASYFDDVMVLVRYSDDKRKKTIEYFLQQSNTKISPFLDYTSLNNFLLGMIKYHQLTNKTKLNRFNKIKLSKS